MHDKLITIIKRFAEIDLHKRFDWDFPLKGLPPDIVRTLPEGDHFSRNVFLKRTLRNHLPDKNKAIEYWIIRQWGGIKRFEKTQKNNERIDMFYNQLCARSLSRDTHVCISSLSKVASFFNPQQYAIYDARATSSLNWLLLKAGATSGFFPVPSGRNTAVTNYDIETIIRLKCGDSKKLFLNPELAYFEYCNLLIELSPYVWEDEERQQMPFYLEMLLFVIAPYEIVRDIKESIYIQICTDGST